METAIKSVDVPALDHDAMMLKQSGCKVDARGKLERRIVANLVAHIERAGFKVKAVFDGDKFTACRNAKEAMELIFNLDEASLRIQKKGFGEHGILLVMGNGVDILSDWTFSSGDSDGFASCMDCFDAEAFA